MRYYIGRMTSVASLLSAVVAGVVEVMGGWRKLAVVYEIVVYSSFVETLEENMVGVHHFLMKKKIIVRKLIV